MQNFLGEGRALIANKRSIVGTIGGDGEPTCRFVQVASVVATAGEEPGFSVREVSLQRVGRMGAARRSRVAHTFP